MFARLSHVAPPTFFSRRPVIGILCGLASAIVIALFVRSTKAVPESPYLVVLGTVQDAGSPQAACAKTCCATLWEHPDPTRRVSSLGLVDPATGRRYLFDATPDLPQQLRHLAKTANATADAPDGIFLTHAHMGHYAGLLHLGREAMGAQGIPVYAMPRLDSFLRHHGPWSQLVALNNIALRPLQDGAPIELRTGFGESLTVTPLLVPHRDEFSETVGFRIAGPNRTALFVPDIDKWQRWNQDLVTELARVDYALLDATFYDGSELPGRDMAEIPHPFVVETQALLDQLPTAERDKVHFIHLNHTNPLLDTTSKAYRSVLEGGYHVARFGDLLPL